MAYTDGSLAMVERPDGQRWLTCNCSSSAAASNLSQGEILPLLFNSLPTPCFLRVAGVWPWLS